MTGVKRVALGTMHGKEAALAPPLARLGIELVVPPGVDTDAFGTFSGERPRKGTMEDAARAKARAAARLAGLAVGLGSEGAYGPHPVVPFIGVGLEILLWRDEATGHELVERIFDEAPVYSHIEIAEIDEAASFLRRIGFPNTALVVAPSSRRDIPLAKGLRDRVSLEKATSEAVRVSRDGRAFIQTDMRAHMNPRRMRTIRRLAAKLADRLKRTCAECGAPGWGLLRTETGLPCSCCGGPTLLVKHEVHGCTACGAEESKPAPGGVTEADPSYCLNCNP